MDYETIVYNMLPRKYKEMIEDEARYAGYESSKESFVFKMFLVFYIIAFGNFAVLLLVINAPIWLAAIPPLIVCTIGAISPYMIYSVVAEARRKSIELLLPDLLLLTASNIKSGLTIDKALLFSARPEFGDLGVEFKKVAFQIYGGQTVEDSFLSLTKKVKSITLERTVGLLVEGLRSGGAVAKLLEETAADIRNTEMLQKEIRSSVMMYIMFIFMAAVLGAPFLFAISSFLVSATTGMWKDVGNVDTEFSSASMIKMNKPDIDINAFNYFSVGTLIVTTFFAGILVSLIQTGNIKGGFKYVPIFMIVALVLYFVAKQALFSIFGSMLGIG